MFCSAAKVMENNFDNKGLNINTNDLSQLLVKNRQLWWMVMNFRVKTLIRHRACSLTHHALSCIFQASLYQRLFTEYESSPPSYGVIWFLLIRYSGSTRHSLESTRLPSHPQLSTGSGLRNIIASSAECVMRGQKMHYDNRKTWGTLPNI